MKFLTVLLFLIAPALYSQSLEYRNVDYYLEIVEKLEKEELKKEGIINDSLQIMEKFLDKKTNFLNEEGFQKYSDIKTKVYRSVFKNYLYQQHIEYKDEIYVLYFSVAGLDDAQWQILRWKKRDWDSSDKIDGELVEDVKLMKESGEDISKYKFEPIVFNYDEGPKNLENVRIFLKKGFLVMERGNLYHSLYDLNKHKLIVNEESPGVISGAENKEDLNKWIKINLHDKISKIIN